MERLHITGAHPFCPVRQAARLGGCMDAPDYVARGATGCGLSILIWGRDEVAAQIEAIGAVESLRRATRQSYLIEADARAWERRTRRDVPRVVEYVQSLGLVDARDLTERVRWFATYLDDHDAQIEGNHDLWGILIAEVDSNLNSLPT